MATSPYSIIYISKQLREVFLFGFRSVLLMALSEFRGSAGSQGKVLCADYEEKSL